MKFPITREALQMFDPVKEKEERKEDEIKAVLTRILEKLCQEFERSMHTNIGENRFIWRQLYSIRDISIAGFPIQKTDTHLPRFLNMLEETFIGCKIIMDPLKTYLIIDWS